MRNDDPFSTPEPGFEPWAGSPNSDAEFSQVDVAMRGDLRRWLETDETAEQIKARQPKQPTSVGWEQIPNGWKLIVVRNGITREYLGPTDELLKIARAAS